MTARQLRLALLIECLSYVAWVTWRVGEGDGLAHALGQALGFALGARALPLLVSYFFLLFDSDPVPRLLACGPLRALRMVVEEYVGLWLLFAVIQPFERLWLPPDVLTRPPGGAPRPPLLLLHGYQCNRGFWFWMAPRLRAAGWTVATHSLEPGLASIDVQADGLDRRVREVLRATGASQVILVGHSMGGLVARAYLRRWGATHIARVVTLGSPHYGSRLAMLAWGRCGRQMVIGNPWLRALQDEPLPVPLTSIYSVHDNQVMPQRACSALAGATNCAIGGVSHLGMAFSPAVLSVLLAVLRDDPRTPSPEPVRLAR
jgi:triacylglycerol lipase